MSRTYTPRRRPAQPEVDDRAIERGARQIELRLGVAIPEGSVLRTRFEKVRAAAKRTEDPRQRLDLLVDAARELRDELPGDVGRSCLPDHVLNITAQRYRGSSQAGETPGGLPKGARGRLFGPGRESPISS